MTATRFECADPAPRLSQRGADQVWSTASAGSAPDTSTGELAALGEHAGACERGRGRLFAVRYAFDTLAAAIAARFWTTIMGIALSIAVLTYLT